MVSKNKLYNAGKKFNKAMMSIVNNPKTGIDSITISSGSEEIVSFKNQTKPQMKTKPNTKIETRKLECDLTDIELRESAESLAHTIQNKYEILAEKKEAMSGFKSRIEKCDEVILKNTNALNTGKEEREIDCEIQLNEPKDGVKTITRRDTGETWEEKMSDLELQEEIF